MKNFKRFFALTLCLLTLCACSAQDEPLPADDGVQGQTDPAPDDAADTPATTEPQPDISESAPPEETEPAGDSEPSGQDKPPVQDETQAPDTVQDPLGRAIGAVRTGKTGRAAGIRRAERDHFHPL